MKPTRSFTYSGLWVSFFLLCWQLISPSLSCAKTISKDRFPIKLSSNGKYLVDQHDQPFFINGDTAWSLVAQLSEKDAETYLADRSQKGFNLVLVNLIEKKFSDKAPANFSGDEPFTVAGHFGSPNEAYFSHADRVISIAAERGLVVLLDPLYLGWDCGDEGWCEEVKRSSLQTMGDYGRFLGRRYRNFPNIIWLIGGDTDPATNGVASKIRALVAGIAEFDENHLFTAHNGPEEAAMDVWSRDAWLNLNNVYTYGPAYPRAIEEFNRAGAKPFFLIETFYENEHSSTPLSLRRQAYWTVLSGGVAGHIFGNCPIWNFNATSASGYCDFRTLGSWKSNLDSTGSKTLVLVGRLFGSRSFFNLEPDEEGTLVADESWSRVTCFLKDMAGRACDSHVAAARTTDGATIIAYVPSGNAVDVDMSKIEGQKAHAWWFDPRTGDATSLGTFPTSGNVSFDPPDTEDWVLVVDDAARDLPPPGTHVLFNSSQN